MVETKMILDLIDLKAKNDSMFYTNNYNDISNLNELKKDFNPIDYATLEKNLFVLNGSKILLKKDDFGDPINDDIGFCSQSTSNEIDRFFSMPIILKIDFSDYHTSAGITLDFGNEAYCDFLDVSYYRDDDLIYSNTYYPSSNTAYLEVNVVENYNKIILTFYRMNLANRFLKIQGITYGFKKIFTKEDFLSANTNHEINILSSELAVNTLNFSVIDQGEKFNIVNPQGYYKDMQENQKISVFEEVDNVSKLIGNFYLTKWSNSSIAQADFEAQDLIGILDSYKFYGGMYSSWQDVNAGTLIDAIFQTADITEYEIEEELYNSKIVGYMPIMTCKEALQWILFKIGGVCNTSGVETAKIYRPQKYIVEAKIDDDKKILDSTKVELNETVTGVEFTIYLYSVDTSEEKEIANGLLDGITRIEFEEPVDPNSISGHNCVVLEKHYNYAIIKCNSEEPFKLFANKYIESKITKTINKKKKWDLKENVLTVDNVKIISETDVNEIAERILEYYSGTYNTTVEAIIDNELIGNCISVNTFNNNRLIGNITEIDRDLILGNIATLKIDNAILKEGYNEFFLCGNGISAGQNDCITEVI